MTKLLLSLGLTRDSLIWFWSRLVSGALILLAGGTPLLSPYLSSRWIRVVTVAAVVILWFAGKYDTSPLPSKAEINSVDAAPFHHP